MIKVGDTIPDVAVSIMVDGAGTLHIAWDQHNNTLRYARGRCSPCPSWRRWRPWLS